MVPLIHEGDVTVIFKVIFNPASSYAIWSMQLQYEHPGQHTLKTSANSALSPLRRSRLDVLVT